MPSKDPINPKANAWMDAGNIHTGTVAAAPKSRRPVRRMAGQILRLAHRLHADPDELAKKFPADTVRRLQYPVREHVHEDGTRTYEHDLGISDGRASSLRP